MTDHIRIEFMDGVVRCTEGYTKVATVSDGALLQVWRKPGSVLPSTLLAVYPTANIRAYEPAEWGHRGCAQ